MQCRLKCLPDPALGIDSRNVQVCYAVPPTAQHGNADGLSRLSTPMERDVALPAKIVLLLEHLEGGNR